MTTMTTTPKQRIAKFEQTLERLEDDFEDFDDDIVRIPDMTAARYERFLTRRAATPYGRVFASFRHCATGQLVSALENSSAVERTRLISLLAKHLSVRTAIWRLMEEYRWRIQKARPADRPPLLRLLLRFAVLAEDYLDEVEAAHLLTSAWGDAEDAGFDPSAYFAEAAELASTRKLSHGQSARDLLRKFEPYDYGAPR